MRPLTLDDLLPLEEFAGRRREFFAAHARYLDRYRRVRVGPAVTLVFANRQTLWFHVQELLRVARLSDAAWIQQELDVVNRLLPGREILQAALLLAVPDESRWLETLAAWRDLRGDELAFVLGSRRYPARLVTCRPEDHCAGTAYWVQFALDAAGRALLADFRRPVQFVIDRSAYRQHSAPLDEDVRQSLLDDLELSDRDAA